MIAHVPLMAHGAAKRVLIIGGGDGGTLKEVLKHPVDEFVLVEDRRRCHRTLETVLSAGVGRRLREFDVLLSSSETASSTSTQTKIDAVIVPPLTPTRSHSQGRRTLPECSDPGGMIALQSGAPFYNPEQLESVCSRLACSFDGVRPFLAPVPNYAGGMLALVAGGEGHKALPPPIETLRAQFDRLRPNTGYYTPEVDWAAFTLAPAFTPAPTRVAKPEVPSQPATVHPACVDASHPGYV